MVISEESISQHPASTVTGNTNSLSTKRGFIPMSLNSVATTDSQNPQILCNAGSSPFDMAHGYCLNQPAALLLVHIAKHSHESGQWGFCTNYSLETITDNAASHNFHHGGSCYGRGSAHTCPRSDRDLLLPRTRPRHWVSSMHWMSYKLQYEYVSFCRIKTNSVTGMDSGTS